MIPGGGGAFGTNLHLGDLGNCSDDTVGIFVNRLDGGGTFSVFLSGPRLSGYGEGRVAMSPDGLLLAVNSSTTVYLVHATTSADFTGDEHVDASDLALLLGDWGNGHSFADLNCDGAVDAADLAVLLGAWG
ncbi:MAG: hypothetical protein U0572_13030 [Phycisphaerales bacterium]